MSPSPHLSAGFIAWVRWCRACRVRGAGARARALSPDFPPVPIAHAREPLRRAARPAQGSILYFTVLTVSSNDLIV